MKFFTSDTHFGHEGIISYCDRPFKDVAEMDAEMIRRWNIVVGQSDTIFHIGDFSFCGLIRTREILSQLNGHKVLIRGNHDKHFYRKDNSFKDLPFQEQYPHFYTHIQGVEVQMSHYPYRGVADLEGRDFSDKQIPDTGGWLIHGHVHRGWKVNGRMINVGVDQWSFAPVSEDELLKIIRN